MAEKLAVAQYFIASSPTGEITDVVKDVEKLVDDKSVLTDEQLVAFLKDYHHEQMSFAPEPQNANQSAMVCQQSLQADGRYFNPVTNQLLTFDFRQQKFTAAADSKSSLPDNLERLRAAVQTALDSYANNNYKSGKVCAIAFVSEAGKVTVNISGKNVNLGSFWTGGWRSSYSVDAGNAGPAALTGTIKVNVHYFEDGNVQMHSNADKKANLQISGKEQETASAIVGAISKFETEYHANLEEMYVKMQTGTFKQMRKFYGAQKQPMNWNLNAHAMASEMGKQASK